MKTTTAAVCIAAICASGISCRMHVPTSHYLIDQAPEIPAAGRRLPLSLAVNNVRAPSRYGDMMFYRAADYEVGFYEYSHWVEPPAEMVKRAMLNALRSSGLFARVDPAGLAGRPDLVLQAELTAFDQVLEADGTFAECGLAMEILRCAGGDAVWSYEATGRVRQEERGKFVAAMSEAVRRAIVGAIGAMEASDALAAAAAPTPPGS